jgi:16S rRNA (cytidine1402-2'-O)-methyltransferase
MAAAGAGWSDGFVIDGVRLAAPPLAPALYVVATPIGNLADVTLRALRTLAAADLIVCEDTRVSRRLLDRYGIRRPLATYHEHNAQKELPRLLTKLAEGKALVVISDAGTPLVSDPGYRLVVEAVAAGHPVVPIPGPSAVTAALSAAALPTDAFQFAGFLPAKTGQRRNRLADLAAVRATLVFYEAPQRLAVTLADLADIFGRDRRAVVAREVTKAFETFQRGTLAELVARFPADQLVKGEIVILVAPGPPAAADDAEIDRLLGAALTDLPASAAAAAVARATGSSRKAVYARALALKKG